MKQGLGCELNIDRETDLGVFTLIERMLKCCGADRKAE